MNLFIIPSWYPSEGDPLNGIFVKEQTLSLAKHYPDLQVGISLWGQNDEAFLLHAFKPLTSLRKLLAPPVRKDKALMPRVNVFFSPAYSYTSRINRGNIAGKIKACEINLSKFEAEYGKVDVIHAHVAYPAGYIALQLSHKLGIPFIVTEHMTPFPQKHHLTPQGKLLPDILVTLGRADTLIAVSEALKSRIAKFGISRSIQVVPNFIPSDLLPLFANQRSASAFTFITVCGLHFQKGLRELFHAIRRVVSKDPDFKFIIVGDGPHKSMLVSLSKTLSIEKHVELVGYQPRETIRKWYGQADAHILTSYDESFGVAYIEAMAAGLPSIANAKGGPLDIIDEHTGILLDNIDPKLIAEKIHWLKENIHLYEHAKIRSSFEQRFSTPAVAPLLRSTYEALRQRSKTT